MIYVPKCGLPPPIECTQRRYCVTDPSWASGLPFEGLSRVGPSYNKWSVWPVCTSLDWPHPYVGTITANSELNFAISWLRGLAIWRDRAGRLSGRPRHHYSFQRASRRASASSHRNLSSAVFITNIAESDFPYTQLLGVPGREIDPALRPLV